MVICLERSADGPADATATPSSLASVKSRMVLPFWCRLTQVVLEKRPLNGSIVYIYKCAIINYRPCCNVFIS